MAVNGNVSIFRLTNNTLTTETQVSDKIEFDNDNAVPDAKGHILSAKHFMSSIDTENPTPGSQDAPNTQDSGNAPAIVDLRGYFDEKGGNALGIASARNWLKNAKVIKTHYPKGRFGYRNNMRDEFDVVPDSTGGYKLTLFETDERYEYLGIVPFHAVLKFFGDLDLLGA